MQKAPLIISFFLFFNLVLAGDVTPPTPKQSVQQYIEKYSAIAIEEMLRSRIPASITLAQGILESGNGNSRLSTEANNHFGIKCKNTWTGATIFEDDDAPQECFRKYPSAIDSYKDHSDFLMKNQRYAFLFDLLPTDYKGWAYGLKKAGYATNPQYGDLLIAFIEKHKLHEFDKIKISEEEAAEVADNKEEIKRSHGKEFTINGVKAIAAIANESFTQIAIDYDLKVHDIYRNNDLPKDAVCNIGDTIFIEPKKNKGEVDFYTVIGSETMRQISQRFGVKLEKLLERNLMKVGEEPEVGEKIHLKSKRSDFVKITKPAVYSVTIVEPNAEAKIDTTFNNKVYDNAAVNLETQKQEVHAIESGNIHEFKENLSFFHTVQKGENLFRIGKKYGVSVQSIKYLNLLATDSIEINQRLIINPAITDIDTKEPQTIPGVHKVKQGQTLYSIANLYNISILDLKATNNLQSDTIYIGQQLVVVANKPEPKTIAPKEAENPSEQIYYTIEKGETLYSISRKFGVTVEAIKELNYPLNVQIQVGQKLRIR